MGRTCCWRQLPRAHFRREIPNIRMVTAGSLARTEARRAVTTVSTANNPRVFWYRLGVSSPIHTRSEHLVRNCKAGVAPSTHFGLVARLGTSETCLEL